MQGETAGDLTTPRSRFTAVAIDRHAVCTSVACGTPVRGWGTARCQRRQTPSARLVQPGGKKYPFSVRLDWAIMRPYAPTTLPEEERSR